MRLIVRFAALLLALLAPTAALADVTVHFHSFNGSALWGRYPHTFVVFEGKLASGEAVSSNFGFTAASVTPAILVGPVKHAIMTEEAKWLTRTNRHFSITVGDGTYHRMMEEVAAWRNAPGKYYDLDKRNCIHFVGAIARLAGVTVDFPAKLLRKPKAWLNHLSLINPQLGARQVK
jgi:hypothetical protein